MDYEYTYNCLEKLGFSCKKILVRSLFFTLLIVSLILFISGFTVIMKQVMYKEETFTNGTLVDHDSKCTWWSSTSRYNGQRCLATANDNMGSACQTPCVCYDTSNTASCPPGYYPNIFTGVVILGFFIFALGLLLGLVSMWLAVKITTVLY